MENKDKQLILTEADLLGQGAHKKVYRHPEDPARCVKICFKEDDEDIRRELDYRHRCKRTYYSQMLPKYCGTVETNLGTGYVFELVRDFDGQMSRTLQTYLENPGLCEAYFHTNLAGMLAELKKELAVVVKIVVTKNILKLIVPSEPLTAISTMLRNTLSVDAALLPLTEYPTA